MFELLGPNCWPFVNWLLWCSLKCGPWNNIFSLSAHRHCNLPSLSDGTLGFQRRPETFPENDEAGKLDEYYMWTELISFIYQDGIDLPPVISFDVGAEDVSMPSSKGSYFVSEQSQQVAVLFLQQYLSIYDSEDRQPLLNAYHDSAVLSMSVSFAPGQAATGAGRYSSASRLIILALLFSPYY